MDADERYYGVLLPIENRVEESVDVFTNRREAEQRASKFKGIARFKAFKTYEEALSYSRTSYSTLINDTTTLPDEEKGNPFKTPRPEDMSELNRVVESGNTERFTAMVWGNPRYLVTHSDNPTIVQTGCRMNALHLAAKCNQAGICRIILDTVDDPRFISLLYRDGEYRENVATLSDLYLNTPSKGLYETPLHIATKFGFLQVVQVLASHPCCDRLAKNVDGMTPQQVIGDRCKGMTAQLKSQMENALDEQFFVPMMRTEDDSLPPKVGEPWSPSRAASSTVSVRGMGAVDGLMMSQQLPSLPFPSKYVTGACSPVPCKRVMSAIAGPMTPDKAREFHAKIRLPRGNSEWRNICRSDSSKGLERIGRELASDMQVPWKEHWDFLGSFCDIRTADGLSRLEDHLQRMHDAFLENEGNEVSGHSRSGISGIGELSMMGDLCHAFGNLHLSSMDGSYYDRSDESQKKPSKKEIVPCVENKSLCTCWSECVEDLDRFGPIVQWVCHNVAEQLVQALEECTHLFVGEETAVACSGWEELLRRSRNSVEYLARMVSAAQGDMGLRKNVHAATGLCIRKLLNIQNNLDVSRFLDKLISCAVAEESDDSSSEVYADERSASAWSARLSRKRKAAEYLSKDHLRCILTAALTVTNGSYDCTCLWEMQDLEQDIISGLHLGGANVLNGNLDRFLDGDLNLGECDYFDAQSTNSHGSESSDTSSEEMVTPDEGLVVFLNGDQPTKTDMDVYLALKGVSIDPILYPHTYLWHITLNERLPGTPLFNGKMGFRSTPLKTSTPVSSTKNPTVKRNVLTGLSMSL